MIMWQREKYYYQIYCPPHRVRKNLSQNLLTDWNLFSTDFKNWMAQDTKGRC